MLSNQQDAQQVKNLKKTKQQISNNSQRLILIYVPQSNPVCKQPESQNNIGELIKYFKEKDSEAQKVKVIDKEKIGNELETDKRVESKAPTIISDEEEARICFSNVDR